LFHNDGSGVFEDVTSAAGLDSDAGTGFPLGINFVDYDHDGDVDLYVVRSARLDLSGPTPVLPENATRPGNVLFRNNGDGTFTDQTAETGLEGVASGVAAIGTDLNNDRAVDFVLTGWGPDPGVYLNPRAGAFAGLEWTAESAAPTVGVVVADFDKLGRTGPFPLAQRSGHRVHADRGPGQRLGPRLGPGSDRLRQRRMDGSGGSR
jgi:hypothetical protein